MKVPLFDVNRSRNENLAVFEQAILQRICYLQRQGYPQALVANDLFRQLRCCDRGSCLDRIWYAIDLLLLHQVYSIGNNTFRIDPYGGLCVVFLFDCMYSICPDGSSKSK